MAKPTWRTIVAPGVNGYIVRWYVQKVEQTLDFEQLPYLRVEGAQWIVACFPRAGDLTGVAAKVELDGGGGEYLIAFNLDQ